MLMIALFSVLLRYSTLCNLKHRCFIVATCDKGLKKRIRAIPGVPILSIVARKYAVERLPEVEALH